LKLKRARRRLGGFHHLTGRVSEQDQVLGRVEVHLCFRRNWASSSLGQCRLSHLLEGSIPNTGDSHMRKAAAAMMKMKALRVLAGSWMRKINNTYLSYSRCPSICRLRPLLSDPHTTRVSGSSPPEKPRARHVKLAELII
jgi:hypothetical protein